MNDDLTVLPVEQQIEQIMNTFIQRTSRILLDIRIESDFDRANAQLSVMYWTVGKVGVDYFTDATLQ